MSEPLLSIGTFSRAASLSVKTLRAYHAQGLLTPAAVDPETGFRRYAAGQLAYVTNVSDGVPPSAYQTDIVWPLIPRKDTP